ncbi:MAG: DNA primase [Verrucomicrobia bacterium]|nr:DNA primase [Verrucomicrobiota bacterium]
MSGFFSPATLEQVRSASDIVDVIGSYVPLKRAGANFVALCPFHREKTPSFNVNPHKQIFHCFGCHKGGDVFTFVKEFESIDFPEAVKRLAERAKIPLDFEKTPGQQQSKHLKETLLQIHEQITQRWQTALGNDAAGQIARDYLAKRGVSDEAVKLFRLGYAPEAWDDTVNWAKSKGHDLTVVEKSGLIIQKADNRSQRSDVETPTSDLRPLTSDLRHYYDRFRGRLIFPICDEQGRVIGFSGRVLSGDEKTAKYVNSPETPIFTKGKVFFGLDKSKRAILDAGFAIICEGQLDLIACFMAGIKNIVAPQGTALTADHTRILKRYVEEVVLCFDSDTAGQAAAVRSLDSLLASDLAIRVVTVPAPHDPDSFIKESGGTAFQQLIDKAEGFFDFYLNQLCASNDVATDKGRHAVLKHMAEAVHKTNNLVLTDKYAQKTALRLAVSPESVRAEFKKVSRPTTATAQPEETQAADEAAPRPSLQEFWLLKLLLLSDEQIDWVAAHLNLDWVSHAVVRQVVSKRLAAHRNDTWQNVAVLLTNVEGGEARSLITEALADERKIPNPEQQLKDILLRLRNQFIDRQLTALTQRANQPELPEPEQHEFLRRQAELRKVKRQPLSPLAG